jgi:serine/threonine protein kinase
MESNKGFDSKLGFIWNDYFIFKDEIGFGSFSKVYKVIHISKKETYALKKISKSRLNKTLIDKFMNEIELMKTLNHLNIVKLIDYYVNDKYIILILEYCNCGSLKNLLNKGLNENEIRPIVYQIVNGMYYLNKMGIIHRDLKPDNILLTTNAFSNEENLVKIIDFGFSNNNSELYNTICGTPMYMSPEIIAGLKYNSKSDIWSLGIITYELFHNKHPYDNPKSLQQLNNNILNNKILYRNDISPYFLDLLHRLLEMNPTNRIDYDALLNHPWFFSKTLINNDQKDDIFFMELIGDSSNSTLNQNNSNKKIINDFDKTTYLEDNVEYLSYSQIIQMKSTNTSNSNSNSILNEFDYSLNSSGSINKNQDDNKKKEFKEIHILIEDYYHKPNNNENVENNFNNEISSPNNYNWHSDSFLNIPLKIFRTIVGNFNSPNSV